MKVFLRFFPVVLCVWAAVCSLREGPWGVQHHGLSHSESIVR
jgi:hypothetical protein